MSKKDLGYRSVAPYTNKGRIDSIGEAYKE
jgi:hypothetical protein